MHGPNIPGPYAILLFIASDLASLTSPIHNWVLFLLWLHLFILSGVSSPLISSSILGTYRRGEFIFQCPIFLPLHTVHICIYIWHLSFSFWLTSLWLIGSRFIYLIRTDSNAFLLWLSNFPWYICTKNSFIHSSVNGHLVSPLICCWPLGYLGAITSFPGVCLLLLWMIWTPKLNLVNVLKDVVLPSIPLGNSFKLTFQMTLH